MLDVGASFSETPMTSSRPWPTENEAGFACSVSPTQVPLGVGVGVGVAVGLGVGVTVGVGSGPRRVPSSPRAGGAVEREVVGAVSGRCR